MTNTVYSVSQLNNYIKSMFEKDTLLGGIYVRGEISNCKLYPSGHWYFTLKDTECAVRCVMFKRSAMRLRFNPENGMKVIAMGRVSVFPRDGAYQLYCEDMVQDGVGDLHAAFEQLKEKLAKEGLFDSRYKKSLPKYPERIGIITSSAGAAVHDMIRILRRRYPLAKVLLLPVRVQGVEAPPEIVSAIRYANRHRVADVLITGRGGGSLEDLWAFNDERVARAIFESEIPVISAVGHEPDVTISDYVADRRAATPSNAAEIAVPDMAELLENLDVMGLRMSQTVRQRLKNASMRLQDLAERRQMKSPMSYIEDKRVLVDNLQGRLVSAMRNTLSGHREEYVKMAASLDALSPMKVLGRGYSVVRKTDGRVVRSVGDVSSGEELSIRLEKGEITCTVN